MAAPAKGLPVWLPMTAPASPPRSAPPAVLVAVLEEMPEGELAQPSRQARQANSRMPNLPRWIMVFTCYDREWAMPQ
jgi:hypothetical protein